MNNKKVLFFAFFCLLISGVNAQNTSLGLRAGLNFANVYGEDVSDDNSMKLGANFGALVTYSISPKFAISGEINYSGKGTKSKNLDKSTSLNYLEVPVYGSFFLGSADAKFRPKLMLGGYFGYLMSAKYDGNDITDGYKSTDLGGVFGLGGHYRVGEGNWINIDLRYGLGLTNIIDSQNASVKNGVLSLNLAYTFPLGNY